MKGEFGVRIATEIAEREGVDPAELTPPLHQVVDPEALDVLFEPTATTDRSCDGRVTFTYLGYEVTVTDDGEIDVAEATTVADRSDGRYGTTTD